MKQMIEFMNAEHTSEPFTEEEIDAALKKMTDANQIMVGNDLVFLI